MVVPSQIWTADLYIISVKGSNQLSYGTLYDYDTKTYFGTAKIQIFQFSFQTLFIQNFNREIIEFYSEQQNLFTKIIGLIFPQSILSRVFQNDKKPKFYQPSAQSS